MFIRALEYILHVAYRLYIEKWRVEKENKPKLKERNTVIQLKGERSSEFYVTLFELEGVRNEEKGAFLEQNISLALLYNIKAISETS